MRPEHTTPILAAFQKASGTQAVQDTPKPQRMAGRKTPPFSLRLTEDERAYLDQKAGKQPLGAYIRDQLLGNGVHEKRRILRKPQINDTQYATLLAMLGDSRLASNLNQLAKHANMGSLDVSEEIEAELVSACAAIIAMRDTLFAALGHKPPQTEDRP